MCRRSDAGAAGDMQEMIRSAAQAPVEPASCSYGPFTFLPTLTQLRAFREVTKAENISRASETLLRSQSAVSQAIRSLEAALAVALFERTSTGSYLTDMGRILEFRADKCFARIEAALARVLADRPGDGPCAAAIARRLTRGQILALAAVNEHGSFAQAAGNVQVSPTSLHRSARDLENQIGVRLFINSAQGVTTSEAGARLSSELQLAVRELEWAEEEIRSQQGALNGRLLIGSLLLLGSHFVADSLDRFCQLHPEVKVFVTHGAHEKLLLKLRSGALDFLICHPKTPAPAGEVVHETLAHDPFVLVVRREHPLAGRRRVTLSELIDSTWIVPRPGALRRTIFDNIFQGRQMPHFNVETHALPTMLVMASKCDRIALMTRSELALAQCLGDRLQALDYRVEAPPATLGLTTRVNWEPTRLQRAFLDFMRNQRRDRLAS